MRSRMFYGSVCLWSAWAAWVFSPVALASDDGSWKWSAMNHPCGVVGKTDLGSPEAVVEHIKEAFTHCSPPAIFSVCTAAVQYDNVNKSATVAARCDGTLYPAGDGERLANQAQERPGCSQQQPQPVTENPVVIHRGEKYYHAEDGRRGAAFPLVMERFYRSHVRSDMKTKGTWSFSYLSNEIRWNSYSDVRVVRPDGMTLNFYQLNTSSAGDNYALVDKGFNYKLYLNKSTTPDQWELTRPDGFVEIQYDSDLRQIRSPQGYTHTLAYQTVSSIDYVHITDDQSGKTLTYKLGANKHPVELLDTTGGGSVWLRKYTWDAIGRLEKVVYADDTPSDDTDNFSQVFGYDATHYNPGSGQTAGDFKYLITGIDECQGSSCVTHSSVSYDALGRVTSSGLLNNGSPVETTAFAYNWDWSANTLKPETTVTNQSMLVTVYVYTTDRDGDGINDGASGKEGVLYNRNWLIESVQGAAETVSGCQASSSLNNYDNNLYLSTTEDTLGNKTRRTRNGQGRITTLETALDNTLQPVPASQKVDTAWHSNTALNLPTQKTYYGHSTGAWEDYRQTLYTYYSGNNRLATRTEKDLSGAGYADRTWTYHYLPSDTSVAVTQMSITDPEGHLTTYDYSAGQVTSIKRYTGGSPAYLETAYSNYNAFGFPGTITDTNGIVTALTYDARGQVNTATVNGTAVTDFDYSSNGLLQKVTRPDGSYLEYFYNDAHHLIGIKNQNGEYIEYTPSLLDGQWTVQEVCTAGDGVNGCTGTVVAKYERVFDALGRVSLIKDASGNPKQVLGYDTSNNLATKTLKGDGETVVTSHDAHDLVTVNSYDALNRLVSSVGGFDCGSNDCLDSYHNFDGSVPSTPETEYAYNGQGLVSSVTVVKTHTPPTTITTSYSYNGFGEVIQEVSPDRGTTTYQYDNGKLLQKTDALNKVTRYQYDNLGRLSGTDHAYTGTFVADITYTYDQNDGSHGSGKGRLTQVSDSSGVTDYKYDALGRVTEKRFDPAGSVGALTTGYAYDAAGALTQIIYPGGRVLQYNRSADRVDDMDIMFAGEPIGGFIHAIAYQPFGGVRGFTRGMEGADLQTLRSFNLNATLAEVDTLYDGNSDYVLSYQYDAFNNISHIGNSFDVPASETFVYDPQQRLIQATGLYGRYSYTYDQVGNRLTQMLERAPATAPTVFSEVFTDTYTYATGSNRLSSILRENGSNDDLRSRSFGHDAAGNRTKDRTTIYIPGTTTEASDRAMVPAYNDSNRMHSVTPVDCNATPSHAACQ